MAETYVLPYPIALFHNRRKVWVTEDYVGHGPDDPSGYYYHYDGEVARHWISYRAITIRFSKEPRDEPTY